METNGEMDVNQADNKISKDDLNNNSIDNVSDNEKLTATLEKVDVLYCGVCSVPPEYCSYGGQKAKCKEWLAEHDSGLYESIYKEKIPQRNLNINDASEQVKGLSINEDQKEGKVPTTSNSTEKEKKKAKNSETKEEKKGRLQRESKVTIKRLERNKRKFVTAIHGMEVFDIDLKKAAKMFAQRFACGGSVTKNNQGQDEIVVQGDVADEIVDLIQEKYPIIPAANLVMVEGKGAK